MLFCSYCLPVYACHLWNNYRKSSYNRIKVAYRSAPRGCIPGRALQMTACAPQTKIVPPPKRGLCPEEINRLGATEVQIEALDSQNSAYRPSIREQEMFFWNFCGLAPDFMKLCVYFGTKNFFYFLVFTLEFVENRKNFEMKTRIAEIFEQKTFFCFLFCLVFTSEFVENRTIFEMITRI